MSTPVISPNPVDTRQRTVFPSLCEVCGIAAVFTDSCERCHWELQHQHPGVD